MTISENEIAKRLRHVERELTKRGYAAAANAKRRSIAVLKASPQSVTHDHDHLWERASSAHTFEFADADLGSESYLEIALRRVAAQFGT